METTITISPFAFYPECDCRLPLSGHEKEEHDKINHQPITYWGIYMGGENVSYTSTRELADKTKVWMEKWLEGRL
ncbi:MAG: hypothetical protein XU11_C0022G0034 [Candidatus Dadabacteria bacterium CSP1-2]|jgi:hypothetical protein|nr:MAG: hypothetical protein XU11_C0022G0034 [Candidatus Dadabacteria bacterium CSP1-2]